ncbi:MAG: hypothetical protein M1834_000068 [Cirrosporium novae-zelandiae]|nr:MAG: hypothetical protein M1834_000068 [Cirrosporium novae-zelandiae]
MAPPTFETLPTEVRLHIYDFLPWKTTRKAYYVSACAIDIETKELEARVASISKSKSSTLTTICHIPILLSSENTILNSTTQISFYRYCHPPKYAYGYPISALILLSSYHNITSITLDTDLDTLTPHTLERLFLWDASIPYQNPYTRHSSPLSKLRKSVEDYHIDPLREYGEGYCLPWSM